MKERGIFKVTLKNEIADYEEMIASVVVAVHPQEARDLAAKESGDRTKDLWSNAEETEVERVGSSAADFSYIVLASRMGN